MTTRKIQQQRARAGELYLTRKHDGQLYRIDETIDGDYMVVVNGFQWGGNYGHNGAGDATFETIAEAREAYENEEGMASL